MLRIQVRHCGTAAWQTLEQGETARVIGVTSRGVFLLAPSQRVVFISCETYRSPLTINLSQGAKGMDGVATGQKAELEKGKIYLEETGIELVIPLDCLWQTPAPPAGVGGLEQARERLAAVARLILDGDEPRGLGVCLPPLLGLPNPPEGDTEALARLLALRAALAQGDLRVALPLAERLLGYGRGLTPSGDDVIMGLLLALNRWSRALPALAGLTAFNRQVVQSAYSVTTTISANLIEAASVSSADERLLTAVDGLFSGDPDAEGCAAALLALGSSSGVDALVGMALVLTIR
jgi:hypothetical protein